MSFQRRLALATRGYRGLATVKEYISEEFTLQELFQTVNIESNTLSVTDEFSVSVSAVEEIGFQTVTESIAVDVSDESITAEIEVCQ
jgi:hypothetical protein